MSDGSVAAVLARDIFAKIDGHQFDWGDRYLLTGLVQEAYSDVLESHRVSASMAGQVGHTSSAASVRSILPLIRVRYRPDWPIQMIVTAESLERYQAVFTMLLQIRRAQSLLSRRRLLDDYSREEDWKSERALSYRIRSRMMWFCNCVHTYLTTIVLGPSMHKLRHGLREALDVDAMISLHLDLTKRVIDASFLGGKLDPIRESVLDMLDIAPILDNVERLQRAQEAEERDRFSRFSAHSSPLRPAMGRPKERALAAEDSDDDDESPTPRGTATPRGHGEKSYAESLRVNYAAPSTGI